MKKSHISYAPNYFEGTERVRKLSTLNSSNCRGARVYFISLSKSVWSQLSESVQINIPSFLEVRRGPSVHIFWMHPLTQVFFESITQLGNFSFIESVALKNIIMHFEIANFNFTHREFEYFEYVYSNPFLNCSMVAVYLLGVVSCFGLRLVSWFEQSGQAGPHRTLVNRLMSRTLDQVSSVMLFFFKNRAIIVCLLFSKSLACFVLYCWYVLW